VIDDSINIITGDNKASTNKVLATLNKTQSNPAIDALKDLIQSSKK
jgi:ribosomal protein L24